MQIRTFVLDLEIYECKGKWIIRTLLVRKELNME